MKSATATARVGPTAESWPLSDGEVHYVWWYIQGSIMEPDVRRRLRHSWGMCQRHAWGALVAEAAFRQNYFHGPAILYQDLLERAVLAFGRAGLWPAPRVVRRLRATGPCLMCDMGLDRTSRAAAAHQDRIEQGRDLAAIRDFAERTREHWLSGVCGMCAGDEASRLRCRAHLLEELRQGTPVDLSMHRSSLTELLERLTGYARSYRWEYRGTETDGERAALLSAVGWCSGWKAGLAIVDSPVAPQRDRL